MKASQISGLQSQLVHLYRWTKKQRWLPKNPKRHPWHRNWRHQETRYKWFVDGECYFIAIVPNCTFPVLLGKKYHPSVVKKHTINFLTSPLRLWCVSPLLWSCICFTELATNFLKRSESASFKRSISAFFSRSWWRCCGKSLLEYAGMCISYHIININAF